jgi:hypothetical protein
MSNCQHISVQDAVSCRKCNPRRLSLRQYVLCIDNGINPHRPNAKRLARLVAQQIEWDAARAAEREEWEREA